MKELINPTTIIFRGTIKPRKNWNRNQKTGNDLKILWSDFATKMLREIRQYHQLNTSVSIARKIRTEIFTATRQLKQHPASGPIELNLEKINEGHRYLVIGNYKIIYKEVPEGILITDVFDTRQDPIKITRETNK